ncbi:MAG: zinc-binding alcohol dehydrogenase [Chloroflexaceae bacterium]|jgi:2-desacetyl-2-hydroxyethyl bacteriochlorophyllide A dehydrogenase|nr:zinc-binding alcohol dehydrogenase [Chloroflexaceae bacterium]
MTKSLALWFSSARHVELRPEAVPPPGPGEVQVQTIASAISHGTEMLVYRGQVPPELPLDLPTLAGSFAFPIKYGYAAVGRVVASGPGVTRCGPGELVFALHPHQTLFNAPESLVTPLPPGLDPVLGVFTANLETALNIVHDTPIQLGETALVCGQGVVGLLVAQLLRLAGARRVFAIEPLERRQELAYMVGVDAVLAPTPDLSQQLRELNGGRAVDVAVEVSGNNAALQTALDCVADEGTVVVASWYGTKPVQLNLGGHFHRGRLTLRSSQVGRLNPVLGPRWDYARRSDTVAALVPRLRLAELISHRLPFAEAANAYRMVDETPAEVVQVVLEYGTE